MRKETYDKRRGWQCIIAGVLLFLSVAALFLPSFSILSLEGNLIPITTFKIVFGGEDAVQSGSIVYYFNFKPSIFLLIYLQVIIIAGVSCFVARNNLENLTLSIILSGVSLVGVFFTQLLIHFSNKDYSPSDLRWGYGFYISACLMVMSITVLVICLIKSKKFWASRKE